MRRVATFIFAGGLMAVALAACAALDFSEPATPLPFAFAGESRFAGASGNVGQAAVLDPVLDDLVLEKIGWRRNGPVACYLQSFKRAPAQRARTDMEEANQCQNVKGKQSAYQTAGKTNASFDKSMLVITALRTCFPKKRFHLAALDVEVSELKPDGSIGPAQHGAEEIYGTGFGEDCEVFAPWSRCEPGEVANGVRVHYDETPDGRTIVGVELRCRTVIPAGAQATAG